METTDHGGGGGWVSEKYAWIPAFLAISASVIIGVSHLLLFFFNIPQQNVNLITQNNTTLWNGWMAILMFYFGDSLSRSRSADTIRMQADTARTAGVALANAVAAAAPPSNETVLEPGESVKVSAEPKPPEDGPPGGL